MINTMDSLLKEDIMDDIFTPEDRAIMEELCKARSDRRSWNDDELEKSRQIKQKYDSEYIESILTYEARRQNNMTAKAPVYYANLDGESEIWIDPRYRKRFMPFVYKDISKKPERGQAAIEKNLYAERVREQKEKGRIELAKLKRRQAISDTKIRQSQGISPSGKKLEAFDNVEKQRRWRAKQKTTIEFAL